MLKNRTSLNASGLLLAAMILLATTARTEANLLSPGTQAGVQPVNGAGTLPQLTGTVLADVTVQFANGGTVPPNLTAGQQPVNMTFRNTNVQVPSYLVPRYIFAGGTAGHVPGFSPPSFQGTLRTVVVREATGGTLDFYLQIANNSEGLGDPNDIFRMSAAGFNGFGFTGDALDVYFRTDGTAANVLPGVTPAIVGSPGQVIPRTADRETANNSDPAFDFASGPGGNTSIFTGTLSRFLLIRTSATDFAPSTVTISGTGTAYVGSFAPPVPEPSFALIGLTALGAGMSLRTPKRHRPSRAPRRRFR